MRTTSARLAVLVAGSALGLAGTLHAQKNKDPYFISQEEISQHQDLKMAYDLIQRLRPRFFRATRASAGSAGAASTMPSTTPDEQTRGDTQSEGILVVVNGSKRGNIYELKQIETRTIESIRYIKGPDAMSVYGYEQAGVIEIVLTIR